MNRLSILFSAALGLSTLSTIGCVVVPADSVTTSAYSEGRGSGDTGHEFRGKVHRLREHYNEVYAEAQRCGASPDVRDHLRDIDQHIHRVASFVFSGEFSPARAQENISSCYQELHEVSYQMRRS